MSLPYSEDQTAEVALVAMGIGIITAGEDGTVTFLNSVAEELTGWSLEQARGQTLDKLLPLRSDELAEELARAGENEGELSTRLEEAMLERCNGQSLPIEYSVHQVRSRSGRRKGVQVALRDVSQKRLLTVQLARLACRDPLTGLPNRQSFLDHLGDALLEHQRDWTPCVLVFMDVDELGLVNTTCGHNAGDNLLQWVAAVLRETIAARDVTARIGGDEFAILLADHSLEQAMTVIEGLQERLQQFCFSSGDKTFFMSATFGVAELTPQMAAVAEWLAAAEQACTMARDRGRRGVQVYRADDKVVVQRRDEMHKVAQIRNDLTRERSRLFAQPILPVNAAPGQGLHFEVLLRLTDTRGQLRGPADLIRAAERFDLMEQVDRWVIRTTLEILNEQREEVLRCIGRCFINISGQSLRDNTLLDFIRAQLAASAIPPQKLCFEITETVAVQRFDQARWFIQEVGSLGCRMALDDFGTGAASFGYLRDLPVHYIKIDGSFIDAMATSNLDHSIIQWINHISGVLGIETVAEAVSSPEALAMLREIGIGWAQGFWLGRPQSMLELAQLCRVHGNGPGSSSAVPEMSDSHR